MKTKMKLDFHVVVHAYAEEKLCDSILTKHSSNYGIAGKELVAPLRRINGETIQKELPLSYTVRELWEWIDRYLYENKKTYDGDDLLEYVKDTHVIEKYFVFNNLRYSVEDETKALIKYLHMMGTNEPKIVDIQLLIGLDAGELFEDDGIRYYMYSKESGSHNTPHVHVSIRHEKEASYSIINGEKLAGDRIKASDERKIREKINEQRGTLLRYWNDHTDGLTVDLNQAFGVITY